MLDQYHYLHVTSVPRQFDAHGRRSGSYPHRHAIRPVDRTDDVNEFGSTQYGTGPLSGMT